MSEFTPPKPRPETLAALAEQQNVFRLTEEQLRPRFLFPTEDPEP